MPTPATDIRQAPPARLHHHAYVTTDQEATRKFYEDVVGVPLVATWTEVEHLMGGNEQEFCHTMYELGDGGCLAFLADHGYCRSLYLTDPNGLILEFTVDHPDVDKIDATRRESAHRDLARWLSGDHSSNNEWRPES